MTQAKFVVGATERAAIRNAPFGHHVITIGPFEDPETAIRADMQQGNRGWPPIHVSFHNLPTDLKELHLSPDQDIYIEATSLDQNDFDAIQRLIDSPDVPDDATVYIAPRR